MRISDWSSDVCSSDLRLHLGERFEAARAFLGRLGARPRARKVRGGLVDPRLVETRVDLIERLAGAKEAALGEQAAEDQNVHLRPNFARLVGDGASSERGGDGHGLDCEGDLADIGRAAPATVLSAGTNSKLHRAG